MRPKGSQGALEKRRITAINLLLRLLEKGTEGPLRTILTTELVIRASCGAQAQST